METNKIEVTNVYVQMTDGTQDYALSVRAKHEDEVRVILSDTTPDENTDDYIPLGDKQGIKSADYPGKVWVKNHVPKKTTYVVVGLA